MPKGPNGQKRPADVIGTAVMVAKIATGEVEDEAAGQAKQGKNPAAVTLGRLGGQKGGKARAAKLSSEERSAIASQAAASRWKRENP